MNDAKLVWVTHEQRYSTIDWALGTTPDAICAAFDTATKPRKIDRCRFHLGAERVSERAQSCWRARERGDYKNCVFETFYGVPADSQPQPPSVTT